MKFMNVILLTLFWTVSVFSSVYAAVGCTLNNPDSDVKRLFPQSTSYKTTFLQIDQTGGNTLYRKVERLLGDKLDNIYETIDVPYAYYQVYQGDRLIGIIHGVNQRGRFGGMQIILATDPAGKILKWYYQKISNPEAAALRSESFNKSIVGLTLADFYKHDYFKTDSKYAAQDPISKIQNPTKNQEEDFNYTLRGIRKNLILTDQFWFNGRNDSFWQKSQELLSK